MNLYSKTKIGIISFYNEGYSQDLIKSRIKQNIDSLRKMDNLEIIFEKDVTDYASARNASSEIKNKELDCLVAIIASWTESRSIFENLQYYFHKPILVWVTTGITTSDNVLNSPAPLGGAASVVFDLKNFTRANFGYIRDSHEGGIAINRAMDFIRCCGNSRLLGKMKIGMMGTGITHTYTFNFDSVSLKKLLGMEVEDIDLLDIKKMVNSYKENDIAIEKRMFEKSFLINPELDDKVLNATIKLYKALKEIIEKNSYNALSINCFYIGEALGLTLCLPFTLLAEEIPCFGGSDVMTAVTQLILRSLSGKVSTYLEVFEQINSISILMSSCGYAPKSICEGGRILCDSGSWGTVKLPGIKNCSLIQDGIITMARLSYAGDHYIMHIAKGYARKPRPYREMNMQWANIRKMPCTPGAEVELISSSADYFLDNLVASIYSVIYGDYTKELLSFCKFNKISYII
jgi:L-fucose isomerase-like protein